ncbi:uncharacterized protein PHA67_006618 [Liasis olivaceus]
MVSVDCSQMIENSAGVYRKEGIQNCVNFLLGYCPLQEQWPQHHTPCPLHCGKQTIPGEDPLDLYCGSYPASWIPQPQADSVFTMEEVTLSEVGNQKVLCYFA